jgi:hypothetical protein
MRTSAGFFYGGKKKRPKRDVGPAMLSLGGAIFCEILALK